MLHTTARILVDGIQEPVYRAVLESWGIHLRNLIEFFHPTRMSLKHPDTVRAEWYVKDVAAWNKALTPLTAGEARRRQALHTHIAHISYKRDARKTRWSTRDYDIVARRLRLFHQHVSPGRQAWFPDALLHSDAAV
ncbi:MAG: hypothetical protein HY701_03775 [Gemmatimonadetes bacterium]|nr:hypothetical protein [Gemmatimonadota bacterium]